MSQKFWEANVQVRIIIPCLLVIAATLYCGPTKADGQPLPTLLRHNTHYESACTEQNLRELKKSLSEIKVKAKDQAWKTISVLLCGRVTKSNRLYIAKLLKPKIEFTTGSIDDDPTPRLVKSSELTTDHLYAQGMAFGAGIADMSNELTVTYYRDEACVGSKKLEYIENTWRLAGVSFGCD
jgi:hypothetical protein